MNQEILNHINKGQVYAIIPARSGSKGVKNKNIRCLNGYPMIAYSIVAAKLCENVDRVIVSTDSEEYAEIARKYGAETPFLRPAELSTDTSTDIEFMEHVINWLYENEKSVPEFFMHVRPTYPIRRQEIMDEAVRQMKADDTATSLRSAHLASNTPYKWFHRSEEGYFSCIPEGLTLDEANNPRQAFPDVYIPDGYVDMLRTEFIVKSGLLHGDKMIGYIVPGGVDIDALKDLEYLEYYQMKNGSPILDYLKENYEEYQENKE